MPLLSVNEDAHGLSPVSVDILQAGDLSLRQIDSYEDVGAVTVERTDSESHNIGVIGGDVGTSSLNIEGKPLRPEIADRDVPLGGREDDLPRTLDLLRVSHP